MDLEDLVLFIFGRRLKIERKSDDSERRWSVITRLALDSSAQVLSVNYILQ